MSLGCPKKCAAVLRYNSAVPDIVNVFTYCSAVLRLTSADSSKCTLQSASYSLLQGVLMKISSNPSATNPLNDH